MLEPGKRIREYEIEGLLGSGGMGQVWLARHTLLGDRKALKVLDPMAASDPDRLRRFVTEGRNMVALQHPKIVDATDFFQEEGLFILVMPYLGGGTLANRIAAAPGGMPLDEVVRIMVPMLRALGHAHRNGVIHRDVKPGNILFDDQGEPFLADFGISKRLGADQTLKTRGAIGTPAYMSPEQILKPQEIDGRSDLYSLGCVLYEMLTGRGVFEDHATSEYALQTAQVREIPGAPSLARPGLPPEWDAMVLKALEKDPAQRWPDAVTWAEAMEHIDTGSGIPSAPAPKVERARTLVDGGVDAPAPISSPVPQAPPPVRKSSPLPWVAGGVAAILLVAAGAWLGFRGEKPISPSEKKADTVPSTQPPLNPEPPRNPESSKSEPVKPGPATPDPGPGGKVTPPVVPPGREVKPTRPIASGDKVVRGPDWKWGDQDAHGAVGTVDGDWRSSGWVTVKWEHGESNSYRWGADGAYDLRIVPKGTHPIAVGMRVKRGPAWKWADQDGSGEGSVIEGLDSDKWVRVKWDNGKSNQYRWGADGLYDLRIVGYKTPESTPVTPSTPTTPTSTKPIAKGYRVMRGKDWKWANQDSGAGGSVSGDLGSNNWIQVKWDNGQSNSYRWGADGAYDLRVISPVPMDRVKPGMRLRVRKDAKESGQRWADDMDAMLGKVFMVEKVDEKDKALPYAMKDAKGSTWWFRPDTVELPE